MSKRKMTEADFDKQKRERLAYASYLAATTANLKRRTQELELEDRDCDEISFGSLKQSSRL